MPIVSITIENAGWPRIGLMTRRSSASPNNAIAAMVAMTTTQYGSPSAVSRASPANAPTIIRSPWAKVTDSVAL